MEKLQLEYLYDTYQFNDKYKKNENEMKYKKKKLILEIFHDCQKNKVRFVPNIYHMNDTLADLEKRYKYYILKDMKIMDKEDYILDFLLMGILLLETFSNKNNIGIELDGFTEFGALFGAFK